MLFANILDTIGNTPIVRINRLAPSGVQILVKLESRNPSGSIKDRMALAILDAAERSGALRPGQAVVEATSGNTGIALAMACAVRGYRFVAFIGDNFSIERRLLMRAYGAEVIPIPALEGASGRIRAAHEYALQCGGFFANQYANPANSDCHRVTTAQEILRAFEGMPLDWFVSGWGSGGTLTGVGQALKSSRPDLRVAAAEPVGAQVLGGRPWAAHEIAGWVPNFMPDLLDASVIDRTVAVGEAQAREAARDLARMEGICCGMSSGASFAAAREIASIAPPGAVVLTILPDTGERYLSTGLFADQDSDTQFHTAACA